MRLGAVVGLAALAPVAYQAGELQNGQVLGHRRLRDPGPVGQGAYGLLAVTAQPLEDRPAGRIGEGLEEGVRCGVHTRSITEQL